MKTLIMFLSFAVLALFPWDTPAGWGLGCAAVAAPRAPAYRWHKTPKAQYALYRDATQIGVFNPEKDHYRPYRRGKFGKVCASPVPLPFAARKAARKAKGNCTCDGGACACEDGCDCAHLGDCDCTDCHCAVLAAKPLAEAPAVEDDLARRRRPRPRPRPRPADEPELNFGVDLTKIHGPDYRYGPNLVARDKALALVKGVPDDGHKAWFTVIGTDAERKQVLDDFQANALFEPYKQLVKVQAYAPDAWEMKGAGFVTTGHPGIYVQAKDGTVLHRQPDYQGGAEALAAALGRTNLRKPDPKYPPDKDPDKRKPDPVIPGLPAIPLSAWALGALGAAVLLTPKKKVQDGR